MSTLPEWSEKIDERGVPLDPLNANRSRNRVRNLFAHGTITSITLRLRYLSIFCWGLNQLPEDSDERYVQLKNIEKLFCLSSRYRQLEADHDRGALRGMDGNSRFDFDHDEFDEVVLDELELLKNDGYAYSQFYENQLQNYLLKRGEFELTEAGKELANIVDAQIGEHRERVLYCAQQGQAELADFQAISQGFANQSVYLEPEFTEEREALQKILLGFVEWSGDRRTGSVELAQSLPPELQLDVLNHLHSTIEAGGIEETGTSKLYQKYHRGYHRYRAAHACFLFRSWQLQSETTQDQIVLSDVDKQQFRQYRDLMRLYWLQNYAGFAIEAQLEALCTFLNSRIPPRYGYDSLLDHVADESKMQREFTCLTHGLETTQGTEEATPSQVTRDLMLYGTAERLQPDVSVSTMEPQDEISLKQAIDEVDQHISDGWESFPAVSGTSRLNEVVLGKALRQSLDRMHAHRDDEVAQFEYWTESLARSVALVLVTTNRLKRLKQRQEWLYNYAYNRFDTPYASISELIRFVDGFEADTPLHKVGRQFISEKVVETHLQVFYSRLSPGNVKRAISFDQDERLCLEVDADRGDRPFTAWTGFIRFDEMNTLLRDAGLLIETDDGYEPTEPALDVLSRLVEVTEE